MYNLKQAVEAVLLRRCKIKVKLNKDGEDLLQEDNLKEARRGHSTNERNK
jgi:hypothetical protein